jgi:hypothetical protein
MFLGNVVGLFAYKSTRHCNPEDQYRRKSKVIYNKALSEVFRPKMDEVNEQSGILHTRNFDIYLGHVLLLGQSNLVGYDGLGI